MARINLEVPYLTQLDNLYEPLGTCNTTSVAMIMKYYGIWSLPIRTTPPVACMKSSIRRAQESWPSSTTLQPTRAGTLLDN